MAVKIIERALCIDCEKQMTEAHVVHKPVPYSHASAVCDWCHKKRYCTRYKVKIGKEDGDGQAEADQA
jgi:hypothetical protein